MITAALKSSPCVHCNRLEKGTSELSSYVFVFPKEKLPNGFVSQHKERRNISILPPDESFKEF